MERSTVLASWHLTEVSGLKTKGERVRLLWSGSGTFPCAVILMRREYQHELHMWVLLPRSLCAEKRCHYYSAVCLLGQDRPDATSLIVSPQS